MSAEALSLFDLPADPLARATDPETSRVAGKQVKTNARERECLDALKFLVTASTAHDISEHLAGYGMRRPSGNVSRRLTSLERQGKVARCGVKTGPYGQPCTLWRLL